ncbi:polysaccharide biosynthesis protein [Bacteroides sp. CAG:1060]|nr:polysaccharide biosynthesis protein [Bacteroides sp. CAG:1060]
MLENSNNKVIAKNTIILYMRMMVIMLVSLYTSRVILKVLGVDDFGLYQAVCGIVGFIVFINNALSTGTSRFLTYALGEKDYPKLNNTFSTALACHIILGFIIVLIAETGGIWMVYHKLVIPPERLEAALFAYHFSIATTVFSIILIPYNAIIIAREKMSFFAYVSIAEVFLKLLIVFVLNVGDIDKLKLYSILLFIVQLCIFIIYWVYCRHYFPEAKSPIRIVKNVFNQIIGFSVWSLFAGCSIALNNQGIIVLLNMFFSSPVVVARTISLQVNSAISQFVNNFRTAVNPQIVKRLASGERSSSQSLLLASTKYSYFLTFIIVLPLYFLTPQVLHLWLGEVPEYTTIFTRLILIQSLFQVFDTCFYTALYAEGRLRENALISPTLGFLMFPLVYVLFKLGYPAVALSWVFLLYYAFLGLVVKPFLIIKISQYTWNGVLQVFGSCLLITLLSIPLPILVNIFLPHTSRYFSVCLLSASFLSPLISVWFLGLDNNTRHNLILFIKNKVHIK